MNLLPYEKRIYSQNNEDGIIEKMVESIKDCQHKFLEIGWGDGTENMTRCLMEKGWSGVGVDVQPINKGIKVPKDFVHINRYIKLDNLEIIFQHVPKIFDFFSLDIDSYDYEISDWLLKNNYRPKVVCLEINAKFGSKVLASFPFKEIPKVKLYRKTNLFGVSIQKYKALWTTYGYRYFGYDSTATNVFFYHPEYVNDLSHLPIHSENEFPFINDDVMKMNIRKHKVWSKYENEIYKGN